VGNGKSYGAVFFAGFLAPSSLACTDPANWKTCQGLSHQRKIEKNVGILVEYMIY
jgi:hypothetical protein